MPFPWTKVTSTRISQLVNDHLHHSQRRRDGSSLVVETGFPTSLVDLFIKNREKLKHKSKKKRQNTPLCDDGNDLVIAESHPSLPSPLPSLSPPIVESPLPCKGVNEIHDLGSKDGGTLRDKKGRIVNANGVLWVILKMFFVVILALGTDRLTIGITISAFSLFFLEYAGKNVYRLLKPCSETNKVALMLLSVWRLLRFKEDELDGKNCGALRPEMKKDEPFSADISSIHENQHVEPKIYLLTRVEEIQSDDERTGCSNFIQSLETHETELKRVVVEKEESFELKRKKSKNAKLKSKMKKFVPKNLRRSRKEECSERLESISVDNVPLCEEQWETDSSSGFSSNSSGRYQKEDCITSVCAFPALSEVDAKATTIREAVSIETKGGQNWIYLVLCLIVLIGLVWGRVFAFMLTLSWCLLLKLGEKLQMYVPSRRLRIGSFDGNSC